MTKHYEFKPEKLIISVEELSDWMREEEAFQSSLPVQDPRHWKMFSYEEDDAGNEWLLLYWGGYEYSYELSRIERPEDLLWLIEHLSDKTWKHMTASRVGAMIRSVAQRKNWPAHGVAPLPNEAPVPSADVLAERAKVTPKVRWEVLKRDGWRCRACGFSVQDGAALHVDHIQPVSKGGTSEKGNLQTLCTACNLGKSDQ